MKVLKSKILFFTLLCLPFTTYAQIDVRFHNEASDTIKINRLLTKAIEIADAQQRVEAIAREFIGTPYINGTLESSDGEMLTVNLDQFDCTTFVETVMALAMTAGEGRSSWHDFIYNLQNIRYRNGAVNGYSSRLHYVSDWIVDNVHRGNFKEVTSKSDLASYEVKTIDYITSNRDLYPALENQEEYERMKMAEIGYRNHRYPYIKAARTAKAIKNFLKSGDIIALTTKKKGLDVSHMGIIVLQDNRLHLLHASSAGKEVIIDQLPLDRYIQRNRNAGFRIIRLNE